MLLLEAQCSGSIVAGKPSSGATEPPLGGIGSHPTTVTFLEPWQIGQRRKLLTVRRLRMWLLRLDSDQPSLNQRVLLSVR
jgi:hypothetical protein